MLASFTVNSLDDTRDANPGDGVAEDISGATSLRAAIEEANALGGADAINFGVTGPINLSLGELVISDNLNVTGPGADQLTIDAAGNSRVLVVSGTVDLRGLSLTGGAAFLGAGISLANSSTQLTLSEMTISGNTSTVDAGGIFVFPSSTLTVTDSTISDNSAVSNGGGIMSNGGTLTVTNSTISGNTADSNGGGIWNRGELTVVGSTISGNSTANDGGGVFHETGTLTVNDSTISANSASYGGGLWNAAELTFSGGIISGNSAFLGGGIANMEGVVAVTGSTLSGNTASLGGGIANLEGVVAVTSSTLSENFAFDYGGGIYSSTPGFGPQSTTITNSTISGNTAGTGEGGGVYNYGGRTTIQYSTITGNDGGGVSSFGVTQVRSSLIAANTGGEDVYDNAQSPYNTFQSLDYNVIGSGDTRAFSGGNDQTGVTDPRLDVLADNGGSTFTHALLSGSPAINAGAQDLTLPLDFDQRGAGFPRVSFGRVDVGAYEIQPPGELVVSNIGDDIDFDFSPGELSLREALFIANGHPGQDAITFDENLVDVTINLENGQLLVTDDVTITGPGAELLTLHAGGLSRVLAVDSGNVEISGLSLTGGNSINGAGIGIFNASASVAVSEMTISGNSAGEAGGGILNEGSLTVTDSRISGNSAGVAGGGIQNSNELTVLGSTISGNSANSLGGGIQNSGDGIVTVIDSSISGNSAGGGDGGGINSFGMLTVTSSTISGNSAGDDGGGVWSYSASNFTGTLTSITNSTITGNVASRGGGAFNRNGLTRISYTTITSNSASIAGSGAWNYGNSATRTEVRSSIIAGNDRDDDIHTNGSANEFVSLGYNVVGGGNGNVAFNGDGDQQGVNDPFLGPLADNGGPTLTHALLQGSPAINAGVPNLTLPLDFDQRGAGFPRISFGRIDVGAYELETFPPTPPGGLVVSNIVDEVDNDFSPGELSLREALLFANGLAGHDVITFDENLRGVVINVENGQLLVTDDVTITGPGAEMLTLDAGRVSRVLSVTSGNVEISGLSLTGGYNYSYVNRGAGIYIWSGSSVTLSEVTISGNRAKVGGGGVDNRGTLTVSGSTISGNSTLYGGGGGISNDGELTIVGSTISGNDASAGGGISSGGILTVTDSTISGNGASGYYDERYYDGGGILNSGTLTVTGSTISDNTADSAGGGIFNLGGTISVSRSTISGNQANAGGGIFSFALNEGYYYYQSSTITVTDSTISDNQASAGGGIYIGYDDDCFYYNYCRTRVTVSGSTISGNSAGTYGGGIFNSGYLGAGGTLAVTESTISGNAAGGGMFNRGGGGIFNSGTLAVTESTISGNQANAAGGGIFNGGYDGSITVTNSTIFGNLAERQGGGIASGSFSGTTRVTNSTISGNSAGTDGGGIHIYSDFGLTVIGYSTITDNSAVTNGDGVSAFRPAGDIEVVSSIIAGNNDSDDVHSFGANEFQSLGYNVIGGGNNSIAFNGLGDQTGVTNPGLDVLADNGGPTLTHALLPGSPAIDAGDPMAVAGSGGVPLFDQRGEGFARIFNGRIDIGAHELQPPTGPACDFDGLDGCNIDDIDALVMEIVAGTNGLLYDLTGDGLVNLADRDQWLADAGGLNLTSGNPYLLGDSNLDGVVDGQDFIVWNGNKFMSTGKWSQADWSADGVTDGQDFIIWNGNKFQSSDAAAQLVFRPSRELTERKAARLSQTLEPSVVHAQQIPSLSIRRTEAVFASPRQFEERIEERPQADVFDAFFAASPLNPW